MRRIGIVLSIMCLSVACLAQQKIDPSSQINWPNITGSGAPSGSCSSLNYGQPYTNLSLNAQYVCSTSGWVQVTGSGCIPSGASGIVQYGNGSGGCQGDSTITINPSTHTLSAPNTILSNTPYVDARAYGADPTGTNDSTTALFNAWSAACQLANAGGGQAAVLFSPGVYMLHNLDLSSLLTNYSCEVYGESYYLSAKGVVLMYDGTGAAGDYLINLGSASQGGFEGIRFQGENTSTTLGTEYATATYGIVINTSTSLIDNQFVLSRDQFYGFIDHAIYEPQHEFINVHIDHTRWDHVGGCALYFSGNGDQDGNPVDLEDWTVDNSAPTGSWATWLETNPSGGPYYFNGTNWGDAVLCGNDAPGGVVTLGPGRYEMNSPQIIQGNNDNGALVRIFNSPGSGNQISVSTVGVGVAAQASLMLPEVATDNAYTIVSNYSSQGINVGSCVKDTATQAYYGGKYCPWIMFSWGQNANQSNGLEFGATGQVASRIEQKSASQIASSGERFHMGDSFIAPNSTATPGTAGPWSWVTAPLTGACHGGATTITTTAVLTSGQPTVTFTDGNTPASLNILPGDDVQFVTANFSAQVSSVSYTSNTVTLNTNSPSNESGDTMEWQACTVHPIPGSQTASAAPPSGTYATGEKVYNTNFSAGQPIFWVCATGGTPCASWVSGPAYAASAGTVVAGQAVPDTNFKNGTAYWQLFSGMTEQPGTSSSVGTLSYTGTGSSTGGALTSYAPVVNLQSGVNYYVSAQINATYLTAGDASVEICTTTSNCGGSIVAYEASLGSNGLVGGNFTVPSAGTYYIGLTVNGTVTNAQVLTWSQPNVQAVASSSTAAVYLPNDNQGQNDVSGDFGLPVKAGFSTSKQGQIGYDSTNLNWHGWLNGADNIFPGFASASPPTTNHIAIFKENTNSWQLSDGGIAPALSGTTESIGGSALLVNNCATGTATVTGATTSMHVFGITPASDPNGSTAQTYDWYGSVTSSNTVTIKVCALVAGTPAATTYGFLVQ